MATEIRYGDRVVSRASGRRGKVEGWTPSEALVRWDGGLAADRTYEKHETLRLEHPTREERRDMEEAHAQGLHDDVPREFCAMCER